MALQEKSERFPLRHPLFSLLCWNVCFLSLWTLCLGIYFSSPPPPVPPACFTVLVIVQIWKLQGIFLARKTEFPPPHTHTLSLWIRNHLSLVGRTCHHRERQLLHLTLPFEMIINYCYKCHSNKFWNSIQIECFMKPPHEDDSNVLYQSTDHMFSKREFIISSLSYES